MSEWIAVISITLIAVISPGADFALVTRNSLLLSKRAGLFTALGIGLGVLVHLSYTLLGIGLLLQQSTWLFNLLKLAGAAYLIYLGIGMLRSKATQTMATVSPTPATSWVALRNGLLTNVLNPKTSIFIISLFMQAVQPSTPPTTQIAYGAFIALAHVSWFSLVAMCFSAERIKKPLVSAKHWIDRLFGALLIGLGAILVTARG